MEKQATYQGSRVFVLMVDKTLEYALISHNKDKSRALKVNLKDLSDLNFVPKKPEEGVPE